MNNQEDDVTHVLLIRVVDLFTFSHSSNRNKQGGHVTLMWLATQVSFQQFDVGKRYFKEILLDLIILHAK